MSIPPGTRTIPLSSVSTPYALPAGPSLSSCLSYQTDGRAPQCLCVSLFFLTLSHSPPFTSSWRHFIILLYRQKGEYSKTGIFNKNIDHIHMTLIMVYCYQCSILLVVVVNLLLCLIYKLNFIIAICVQKKHIFIGFSTICSFRHSLGVLECIPCG